MGFRRALIQQGSLSEPYSPEAFREAVKKAVADLGPLRTYGQYHRPPNIRWDDQTYQGDAYPTYTWACYAAEVAVDVDTCEVKVVDFAAVQDGLMGRVADAAGIQFRSANCRPSTASRRP